MQSNKILTHDKKMHNQHKILRWHFIFKSTCTAILKDIDYILSVIKSDNSLYCKIEWFHVKHDLNGTK